MTNIVAIENVATEIVGDNNKLKKRGVPSAVGFPQQ